MAKLTTLKPRVAEAPSRLKPNTVKAQVRMTGGSWMRLRNAVLRDAKGLCQCEECALRRFALPAHQVDHIIELADGGTDHRSNLRAMNIDCHAKKTAAEASRRAAGR